MPARSDLTRGYLAAIGSAVVLSTTSVLIRYLTHTYSLPAMVLAFWRDLIVSVFLLAGLALLRPALLRPGKAQAGYLVWFGLVMALFNALWTLSVALNGAAVATVLAYTSVTFTVLLERWFLKTQLNTGRLLAVGLSLVGCVLVSGVLAPGAGQEAGLGGLLVGVAAGLLYAVYSMMGRSASQRGIPTWTTLFYTFGVATVFLLGFNLLSGGVLPGAAVVPGDLFWLGDAWAGWGVLLLLSVGPTLAGFGLYNLGLAYLPGSAVNLIATSEPVFTALIAYIFLGERLGGGQIAGGVLILAAVVLLRLLEQKQAVVRGDE